MSDEHSSTLQRAAAEYRKLSGKLRELARACAISGSRRSLSRLAAAFDRRATHFDGKDASYVHVAERGRGTTILPPRARGT